VIKIQKFIRFANFYRFIKDYLRVATSLIDLIKKDRLFIWKENEQTAFIKLKRRFSETPILAIFDPELPIILEINASDYAIGACIMQSEKEKKFHLFVFYFKKILPTELNYDIYDKELLIIVAAF
jgi:hypothetical protein